MIIGIPKAFMYFEYKTLWENFFKNLNFDIITSEDTNDLILGNGIKNSIDEGCLAGKIYLGHVESLINKCDYIFIPRFCKFKNKGVACVKFNAQYDICKNLFPNNNILGLNLDYTSKSSEFKAYMELGKSLGKSKYEVIGAYLKAKRKYIQEQKKNSFNEVNQILKFKNSKLSASTDKKLKILIVTHPYIYHDNFMGKKVIDELTKQNAITIFPNIITDKKYLNNFKYFSKTLYWESSKNILNTLKEYMDIVDGILFLSVFPCGVDSLVNELAIRKVDVPKLNIIVDENTSDTGIITRIESFLEVIKQKMEGKYV